MSDPDTTSKRGELESVIEPNVKTDERSVVSAVPFVEPHSFVCLIRCRIMLFMPLFVFAQCLFIVRFYRVGTSRPHQDVGDAPPDVRPAAAAAPRHVLPAARHARRTGRPAGTPRHAAWHADGRRAAGEKPSSGVAVCFVCIAWWHCGAIHVSV